MRSILLKFFQKLVDLLSEKVDSSRQRLIYRIEYSIDLEDLKEACLADDKYARLKINKEVSYKSLIEE